jgi:signal transduction histidine kinase
VVGDEARLQQVLAVLVDNAVKYSEGRGAVREEVVRAASHVRVLVEDDGVGFDPADAEVIFDDFRQGSRPAGARPTRRFGGVGLGLSIARKLVELHAGTLTATSTRGAAFVIELPLA